MYKKLFKEGNGDHNFLRCPDLQENKFRFCVHQSHWIRMTLSVQELLNLNLPEMIQVLLPTKKSIFLVNGWITVAI